MDSSVNLKNLLPEEASLPVVTEGKKDLLYISIIHFLAASTHKWQAVMTRMIIKQMITKMHEGI